MSVKRSSVPVIQTDDALFRDRIDAGRLLAERLSRYRSRGAVVLAIPRGGVVIGAEVASTLDASLNVTIPRKIGAPGNPELAIGAVTEEGEAFLDTALVGSLGVTQSYIEAQTRMEVEEIRRRMKTYLGDQRRPELKERIVILVDDGIATGATMKAAVRSVRRQDPAKVVVAVPVAPPETVESLKDVADTVVCLRAPTAFYAIGQFYQDFEQVGDAEVISILRKAKP